MIDLYKSLHINPDSSPQDLQAQLAPMLQKARYDLIAADDEPAREQAKDQIALICEAQKQFADQASKAAYDQELAEAQQKADNQFVRENSKYHGPDKALLDLLQDAVEKNDFDEVRSISREVKLRSCESAAYYRWMAEAYARQRDLETAWELTGIIASTYGLDGAEAMAEACIAVASIGLDNDGDMTIIRQAIDCALEGNDALCGMGEALDIQWDLKHGNEALAIQKARTASARHSDWNAMRSCIARKLDAYAVDRYISEDAQNHPYYDSQKDYDSFVRLLYLARDIYPKNNTKYRQQLESRIATAESMSARKMLPGGWWATLLPIGIGCILLSEPVLCIPGLFFMGIGILFFVGLRIPEYMMYKFQLKKELDGPREIIRLVSKLSEWTCKILLWPLTLFLRKSSK